MSSLRPAVALAWPKADARFALFAVVADEPRAFTIDYAATGFFENDNRELYTKLLSRDIPHASTVFAIYRSADRPVLFQSQMQLFFSLPGSDIDARC